MKRKIIFLQRKTCEVKQCIMTVHRCCQLKSGITDHISQFVTKLKNGVVKTSFVHVTQMKRRDCDN